MPLIKCRIEVPTLSAEAGRRFRRVYNDAVDLMVRKAALAFMTAAMSLIPVRTGFARGSLRSIALITGQGTSARPLGGASFKKLLSGIEQGAEIDVNKVSITDTFLLGRSFGVEFGRRLAGQRREYYYPPGGGKVFKSPSTGTQFGTPIDKIIRRSGDAVTFTFQSNISYYSIQDVRAQRSPSSPWRSFQAGSIAFEKAMQNLASKLGNYPEIDGFLEINTITVDDSGRLTSRRKLFA